MKEFRLGRSGYWFDPTASEAIAQADRSDVTNSKPEQDEASPEDLQRYQGVIFEPTQLITDRQLRRLKYAQQIAARLKTNPKKSSNL